MKQVLITTIAAGLPAGAPAQQLRVALERLAAQLGAGGDPAALRRGTRVAEVAVDRLARIADEALAPEIEAVWLAIDQLYLEGAAYRTS